jgi:peptidase M48-like protein
MPKPDDHVLDFYAGKIGGVPTVVLPMQSLMLVEDLATAFAWLYVSKSGFGPIDLYFAMLQRKPLDVIGAVGRRGILDVLGVPANVLKDKRVDSLSLSLRNEAFAFIMVHELGHLLFKHKGLSDITPAKARADEVQSDAFALDVLARSGTPPLGAVLFFQAQIFSLPHRGEYKTRKAWQSYLETASTHPLSVDRIHAMAKMISGPLAAKRQNETVIWKDIGHKLYALGDTLADVELHNCMTKVAGTAPVSLLREPNKTEAVAIKRFCGSQ